MPRVHLTEDTPFLRTPDMYQIESDAPITEYSETTLALIATADNGGIPDGANAFASIGREKRGTVQMQLFARINPETELFEEVGFRSHGCLAAIGCATVIAHMLRSKSFDEALAITDEDLLEKLDGLPVGRKYTLGYAREAVRALIGDFYIRQKGYSLAQLDEALPCESMSMNCLLTENCSLRDSRVDLYLKEAGELDE